jgi:[ribosomal protein S5]-alanine N-acetyltransferase
MALAERRPSVVIRPLSHDDEAEFLAAARASRALHQPWVNPPLTATAFRARLRRLGGPEHLGFAVRRADNGGLVGVVEVTNIVQGVFRSGYLAYYAFAGHERQGLMTAGLRRVARHAFTQLRLHRLEANIQPGNGASIALVKACGFRLEGYSPRYLKLGGRWRDHERWALLKD